MQNNTVRKHRELWIDACRGIGIILVLLGHDNPPFVGLIYAFHIPLFYILSGYLFVNSHAERSVREQAAILGKRYLLPYLVLAGVNLVFYSFLIMYVVPDHAYPFDRLPEFLKGIALVYGQGREFCFPLWFLVSIAISLMVFYFLRRCGLLYVRIIVLCTAFAASWLFFSNGRNNLPFMLHTVPIALLFLETGYVIRHYQIFEKLSKIPTFVILLLDFGIGFSLAMVNSYERMDISGNYIGIVPLVIVSATLLSISLMHCCRIGENRMRWLLKPFGFLGKHTIFFFGFDRTSAYLGEVILKKHFASWNWLTSFLIRCVLLALFFLIWRVLLQLVTLFRNKKLYRSSGHENHDCRQ